jgi:hypothetical protein
MMVLIEPPRLIASQGKQDGEATGLFNVFSPLPVISISLAFCPAVNVWGTPHNGAATQTSLLGSEINLMRLPC